MKHLGRELLDEIIPTPLQLIAAITVAALVMVVIQFQQIFTALGVPTEALKAASGQLKNNFNFILGSSLASELAIISFWATLGLIAYLVCWGAYNVLIEARNDLEVTTGYSNRGHWRGPWETLALKAVAAIGLVLALVTFKYGFSLWLTLAVLPLTALTAMNVVWAVLAIVGFGIQLYLVLLMIQLTFTPWYRSLIFE